MVNWTMETLSEAEVLEAALTALRSRKQQPPQPVTVEEEPHDHRLPGVGALFIEKNIVRDEETDLLLWED